MPLSSEAQALFDHAKNSLPRWLTDSASSALEWLYGFTAIFDAARTQGQEWVDITYLDNAVGAELDQHAADRGTSRRNGESDSVLRERLKNISDALTEVALLTGVNAILESVPLSRFVKVEKYTTSGWNSHIVAVPNVAPNPLKITFVNDGTVAPFLEINGNLITAHFSAGSTTRSVMETALIAQSNGYLSISSSTTSPSSTLTAGDAFTATFELARIVSLRRDRGHMHVVGSSRSFMSRGYRMTKINRAMGYIVILPYGTDAATSNSVSEYLRKNGPGGFNYYVERRLNP